MLQSSRVTSSTSQVCGAEISSIGDCECLEDTPRKTLNNTTNKEHLQASRKEWDEDGADHDDHAADQRPLVSEPLSDISVDDETENASNLSFMLAIRASVWHSSRGRT